MQYGSSKSHLEELAVQIFDFCFASHIEIRIEWLPRTENQKADYLSKIVGPDDWALGRKYFQVLDQRWGPHTIDRFASDYNRQLDRFNSRCWNPGTEAVDAFTQDWSRDNNWLCPPVCLVARTVKKLQACQASGTLVVPERPSALFWPLLSPRLGSFAPYIRSVMYFEPASAIFVTGRGQELVYKNYKSVFSGVPTFRMLAIRLDFFLSDRLTEVTA